MTKDEALKMALETLKQVNAVDDDCDILSLFLSEAVVESIDLIKKALAQPEQEPAVGEQAPENSLPTWSECNLIIENDEFRKRAEAGLEGQVLDTPRTTPEPTALHRFIHEYDDSDPYRSAWFLHRLECVLKEVTTPPQRKPLPFEQVDSLWHNTCTGDFELDIREFARAIESAHGIKGD